jgi:hypothetical protein
MFLFGKQIKIFYCILVAIFILFFIALIIRWRTPRTTKEPKLPESLAVKKSGNEIAE